jgi:hypothetical protein
MHLNVKIDAALGERLQLFLIAANEKNPHPTLKRSDVVRQALDAKLPKLPKLRRKKARR